MLNTILHGTPTARPPLLIAHGLFGSARNWGVIAKRLSDNRQVIAADMRNHGGSFWSDVHDYPAMAGDLGELVEGQADLMGHSMGGKAAMMLALTQPDKVRRLVVADIAPVAYGHSQQPQVDAMRRVDLARVTTRAQAAEMMQASTPEIAAFLLQSLDMTEKRWRVNLDVLERAMPAVVGWPTVTGRFDGPVLFLSGANSDYVLPAYRDTIRASFPAARFARIPGTGHWLHAEKPREFEAAVRAFLEA